MPQDDGSSSDGALADGTGATDATTDGPGQSDGTADGATGMEGQDAIADGRIDSGEGGALNSDYMEGGGCSCSVPLGVSPGGAGWLLVGLGLAARAVRRKRR